MNSIDVFKSIYKPYKYTLKGKSTIIDTSSGTFVIKDKNKPIKELYTYLLSRNFDNFPKIIDESRNDVNLYEYIEPTIMPNEQKGSDLIKLVANLHQKTSYFKEIDKDKYQEIYENIQSNLNYLKNYYNNYYNSFFKEIYMSPSHYLFMNNYYKIDSAINFCNNELDNWFEMVKNDEKERVVVNHNNLDINHFIKNDKDYLISWDNYQIDTPILDLVHFYQNNYFNLNFKEILETYENYYPLLPQEKKLFLIIISMPPKIELNDNEFNNTKYLRYKLDYLFKTEKLVRPYYSKKEEEEETNLD